jgi:hypothetical protein
MRETVARAFTRAMGCPADAHPLIVIIAEYLPARRGYWRIRSCRRSEGRKPGGRNSNKKVPCHAILLPAEQPTLPAGTRPLPIRLTICWSAATPRNGETGPNSSVSTSRATLSPVPRWSNNRQPTACIEYPSRQRSERTSHLRFLAEKPPGNNLVTHLPAPVGVDGLFACFRRQVENPAATLYPEVQNIIESGNPGI